MPAIKTDDKVSERLLSIDWGQQPSDRQQAVPAAAPALGDLRGATVSVRIDDVFHAINAYRAFVDAGVPNTGMLARSLIAQANAIFSQALVNLESRFGFSRVFHAPLVHGQTGATDITDIVIEEVDRLQNILKAA